MIDSQFFLLSSFETTFIFKVSIFSETFDKGMHLNDIIITGDKSDKCPVIPGNSQSAKLVVERHQQDQQHQQ